MFDWLSGVDVVALMLPMLLLLLLLPLRALCVDGSSNTKRKQRVCTRNRTWLN